jgi:hypothetical protein
MTAKRQVATRNGSWIGDQVPFVQIPCEEGQDQVKAPVEHLSNFSKQQKRLVEDQISDHLWRNGEIKRWNKGNH